MRKREYLCRRKFGTLMPIQNMKNISHCCAILTMLFVLGGCSKTKDDYPLANLRAIASFSFKYYHNSDCNIFVEHEGEVDETNRHISVHVPLDTDLTRLRPTIALSPWTVCSPASLEPVDFSKGPVEYVVTAQSGKTAYYTVEVIPDYIYQDAVMLRLYLTDIPADAEDADYDSEDPTSGKSATPDTYEDGAGLEILLERGSGYDLGRQRTHIDLSPSSRHATVEVSQTGDEAGYQTFNDLDAIDYTAEKVIFRITSQSGKVVRYYVTVREKGEEETL